MTAKPIINVTPLIDVLLVLLIIFMVVSPLKPTDFKARIPAEPKREPGIRPHFDSLVVSVNPDSSLSLNTEAGLGTVANPEGLIQRLSGVFEERTRNSVFSQSLAARTELTGNEKIEKTVFIKAPRSADYGSVAKVIDAVKISGAMPISLQIDDLD